MPTVHFVGSIDSAAGNDAHAVSLTYEILPGTTVFQKPLRIDQCLSPVFMYL